MKRRKIERKEGRNQGTKQAYLEGKKKKMKEVRETAMNTESKLDRNEGKREASCEGRNEST